MVLDLHCISFIVYHSLSGILVIYFINIIFSIITITCIIITSGMPALRAGPARCVGLYRDFTVTCMQTYNIYITKRKKKC